MSAKYFFDIPVYRLSEERYYKELDTHLYPGPPSHNEDMKRLHEKHPESKQRYEQHIRDTYGGAWDYNEVIGWIQLHCLGRQIRGEFWRVKAKRIVHSRKKVFEYRTWKLVPEIDIPYEADNTEIFRLIREYLSGCKCKKELKNRYLDTSRFDVIGPYVDWRSLINENENL